MDNNNLYEWRNKVSPKSQEGLEASIAHTSRVSVAISIISIIAITGFTVAKINTPEDKEDGVTKTSLNCLCWLTVALGTISNIATYARSNELQSELDALNGQNKGPQL